MPDVNLSIDLRDLFVDSPDPDGDPIDLRKVMRDAVVQEAAKVLAVGYGPDELHDMREEVRRVRSELIRKRLAEQIDAALSDPIQRTTLWGEPQGEPTSVRELIREELQRLLSAKPNRTGSYGSNNDPGNLAEMLKDATRDILGNELREEIKQARLQVGTDIRDRALRAAVAAIAPEVKTK